MKIKQNRHKKIEVYSTNMQQSSNPYFATMLLRDNRITQFLLILLSVFIQLNTQSDTGLDKSMVLQMNNPLMYYRKLTQYLSQLYAQWVLKNGKACVQRDQWNGRSTDAG